MAFKTISQYDEEHFGGFFLLRNDRDYADVIFLYRSLDDVLIADTHYIKSPEYSGYVHCNGRGCPVCGKKVRVQTKLFIPLYDVKNDEIVFWDRNANFQNQLMNDVFNKYPNPSEYVFRITRHGVSRDINTTYEITVIAKNNVMSYSDILATKKVTFPEYYSTVCREYSNSQLHFMLNADEPSTSADTSYDVPDYQVSPRNSVIPNGPAEEPTSPIMNVPFSEDIPSDVISDSSDDEIPPEVNF